MQPLFSDALATVSARVPKRLQSPKIGIVCGSGLSGLADKMREKVIVPYEDLKGFGKSTVSGHLSALAFGLLGDGGVPVVAMLGRVSSMINPTVPTHITYAYIL
jgi:purine-nucleoside phosphorylase